MGVGSWACSMHTYMSLHREEFDATFCKKKIKRHFLYSTFGQLFVDGILVLLDPENKRPQFVTKAHPEQDALEL